MISIKARGRGDADSVNEPSADKLSSAMGHDLAGEEDADSAWLICMLGEMAPSFLDEEIPERDLEADSQTRRVSNAQRSNWKQLVVVSGFAAACSAAVTGIIVFGCMRRFHIFSGVEGK